MGPANLTVKASLSKKHYKKRTTTVYLRNILAHFYQSYPSVRATFNATNSRDILKKTPFPKSHKVYSKVIKPVSVAYVQYTENSLKKPVFLKGIKDLQSI
jgi:hypothetical protein